jgi:hypothetical protein
LRSGRRYESRVGCGWQRQLTVGSYWRDHGMAVEYLYGLLCVLGRRERRLGEGVDDAVGEW